MLRLQVPGLHCHSLTICLHGMHRDSFTFSLYVSILVVVFYREEHGKEVT